MQFKISKLFTLQFLKKKKAKNEVVFSREESNALECISNGAVMAVELVVAIVANLIVFLALLAFIDNVIGWIMVLVGYEGWTLEVCLFSFSDLCIGSTVWFPKFLFFLTNNHVESHKFIGELGLKRA